MARSSLNQIEKDEIKIISELRKNARESIDKIAHRCKFSRQKVWRIMNKLEESKKVWGYAAVTDDEKLGLKKFFILIKRTTTPLSNELAEKIISREIEKKAQEDGILVDSSFFVHGKYDWVICFTAKNIKHAKKFSDLLQKGYHGYIAEIILLENLFPIRYNGIINPHKELLKEFI
jgi:DNA-binding Lrp family transcriptional regulator